MGDMKPDSVRRQSINRHRRHKVGEAFIILGFSLVVGWTLGIVPGIVSLVILTGVDLMMD